MYWENIYPRLPLSSQRARVWLVQHVHQEPNCDGWNGHLGQPGWWFPGWSKSNPRFCLHSDGYRNFARLKDQTTLSIWLLYYLDPCFGSVFETDSCRRSLKSRRTGWSSAALECWWAVSHRRFGETFPKVPAVSSNVSSMAQRLECLRFQHVAVGKSIVGLGDSEPSDQQQRGH